LGTCQLGSYLFINLFKNRGVWMYCQLKKVSTRSAVEQQLQQLSLWIAS